jgi:hypothetical protein
MGNGADAPETGASVKPLHPRMLELWVRVRLRCRKTGALRTSFALLYFPDESVIAVSRRLRDDPPATN